MKGTSMLTALLKTRQATFTGVTAHTRTLLPPCWRPCSTVAAHSAAREVPPQRTTGFDAVAELARRSESLSPELIASGSALLADDDHHQHHKYKVAIFESSGRVQVAERTGKELQIAVRDMPMFNTDAHKHHHAAISVRNDQILLRTEVVRAVLQRNRFVLFECRRPAQTERVGAAVVRKLHLHRLGTSAIPFELQMLEVVLDQTISFLEHKSRQIRMIGKAVQDDITKHATSADIRRLLPLQKAVTALGYDARETKLAICDVADNETLLALLCLTEDQNLCSGTRARWTPHMQLAHRLLMAYDARIRSLDSALREQTEHLDSTREVWHMQLDAMRNRIIRLNLHLEFAGIATMTTAVPAAFFGMNLVSGLEEAPGYFWFVTACSVGWGAVVYSGLVLYHTRPLRNTQRRMADMTALSDLLMYNVDTIGDVLSELRSAHRNGRVDRQVFAAVVEHATGRAGRSGGLDREKMDLLYRVLDTNNDGLIDVSELERHHSAMHEGGHGQLL